MRGTIVVMLSLTSGVLAASREVVADDKKEPAKKDERFPEKVTLRRWDAVAKQFAKNPMENVKAKKYETDGDTRFRIDPTVAGGLPQVGSEITEADGTVWEVAKSVTQGDPPLYHTCAVKKKSDPPKKPD